MNDFPMPQTVTAATLDRKQAITDGLLPKSPPDLRDLRAASDYAPKRGLAAVAEAVAADPPPYVRTPDYKPAGHAGVIKEKLKALTHREMKDLVAAIFAAHKKINGTDGDAITLAMMPDVLDTFAYGD